MSQLRVGVFILCLGGLARVTAGQNGVVSRPEVPEKTYTAEELKNLDVGPTCITAQCHTSLKQYRFRHGPNAQEKCDPCHQPVGGKHIFTAPAEGNALCLECHDAVPLRKVAHKPVRENCLECHAIHGADDRFFLVEGKTSDLCAKCHEDTMKGHQYTHGPFAQGLCLACHEPHESDNANLLNAPPDQFCIVCHEEIAEDSRNALIIHEPFQKNCAECHSGHGSALRYFIHKPEDELCAKCHEEDVEAARKAKVSHEPVTGESQCSACHTSHFSNFEKLLKQASGPLCLSCHNRVYKQKNGNELADIQAQIEGAKVLHGPVRDGTCVPCHNAHGSEYAKLLNRYFPARFYAPFKESNYELCFYCHDKRVVLNEESRDTNFRNGLQNLHYLHVNREKGRSCRACHAEHASNNPVHIRAAVPYGRWMMEIEYEKTETGGSCATGCHASYGYDRRKPVENVVPVAQGQ